MKQGCNVGTTDMQDEGKKGRGGLEHAGGRVLDRYGGIGALFRNDVVISNLHSQKTKLQIAPITL